MKRILFPYVGDSVGGSHISSLTLARVLPARYEPVIAQHQDGPLTEYLAQFGMTAITAHDVAFLNTGPYRKQFLKAWRGVPKLARFLRDQRIDIVHTNDIRMHIIWGMAANRVGIPHIWHQRTPTTAKRLDKYTAHASKVLAVSEYCKEQFPPAMRKRARVLYNPFEIPEQTDRAAAKAALKRRLDLSPEKKIVGYIANLDTRKRPTLFVEIAKEMVASGRTDLQFIMLGEARSPHIDELNAAIEAGGLGNVVKHVGPHYPISPWIAGLDLLIAPAVKEAFGRTLVEAMLHSVPVVASDDAGHSEIIRHDETGVLVRPDECAAFAKAVGDLLADPDRVDRLTNHAYAHATQTFSAERHVTAMLEIYDSFD